MSRLPLRLRLTLAFTAVMAVVLGVTGLVVYDRFRADLNEGVDRSLETRSQDLAALVLRSDRGLGRSLAHVGDREDDVAQVLNADGSVRASTPNVHGALVTPGVRRPVASNHRAIPGVDGALRLRAVPVEAERGRLVVVVGTGLGDRDESLRTLATWLAGGGAAALLLASLAGYAVAAGALRPVDAMRRRAAAVAPGDGARLPVPPARDEIARLGSTLNEMLDRLEGAFERERAFAADASHELRTPLGILRAELELALREGRSPDELRAALESAAEETERLIRLAEDLLVLARLDDGRLPLRRSRIDAAELLESVAARFDRHERRVRAAAPGAPLELDGDRVRLEQALGNMVDNSLRHGAGEVALAAAARNGSVELHVTDAGGGFDPRFVDRAFDRFTTADPARGGGAGLGLAIVAAIAQSHGGAARAANRAGGGADVWLELPGVSRA
ncbi:MAG: sensor histidine kinase [Thermoleophilaceae bacterium]